MVFIFQTAIYMYERTGKKYGEMEKILESIGVEATPM
jgi:hypothetical protein